MYHSTLDAHHANYQLSLHRPSATGATNVREAPKGLLLQERLGVLPKLLLKSTKWRTKIQESSDAFHDSALYLTRHGRNLSLKGPLVQGSHGIARPHFQLQTRLSIDVHGTAQGQAKQIHSGVIFIHSPVVQLQTDNKNFHFIGHLWSLMVTLASFSSCPSLNSLFCTHNHMDSHMLN